MPGARKLIATLRRHIPSPASRPFAVDLGLAAGFFGAWLALSGFAPVVAAATDELRLAVRTGPYRPHWPPLGPATIGVAALVLAWFRHRTPSVRSDLHEHLQRATLLAAVLLALRLLALFDPLVYVFPFLTVLWSPHALWAVALVFLGFVHLPTTRASWSRRNTYIAAGALFAVCLPLYVLYALYFCQVTMLHGDEGQYLRVTQSLVHDGDMDLTNNLSIEQIKEFHVRDFHVASAPASPEGKVHSQHPIGLSVALVPAYWWGLETWKNPRLATALFMALLASLCVPLLYVYLNRLGAAPWAALAATGMMAITNPIFAYSNQIFPEVPALFIFLVALVALSQWQSPGGTYRSWGRWEAPLLALLTLLLCCLPFLHPRFGPPGLLCGAGLLLQGWRSWRRWHALFLVGLVVAGGLCALIAFHFAFSDDWLGPLRPGSGAWKENALDVSIWKISLPGHWLHVTDGILNNSPLYFFALVGLLALARLRDRRMVIAGAIFAATAGINGLHYNWNFGHGFPCRFLVIALPALALGLAWSLPLMLRRATTSVLLAFALAISAEGVLHTLILPESGYKGFNLLGRSINRFYPFHLHFSEPGLQDLQLLDLGFWGLLAFALLFRARRFVFRATIIVTAAFAPYMWSQTDKLVSRLQSSRSPYMPHLSHANTPYSYSFDVPLRAIGERASGPGGTVRVRQGHTPAGMFNYSPMYDPMLGVPHRGIYELRFRGLRVKAPPGELAGYLALSRSYTAPAVSRWNTITYYPLFGDDNDEDLSLAFDIDRQRICYIQGNYTGTGELSLDGIKATFIPFTALPIPKTTEMARVAYEKREHPIEFICKVTNLPKGRYRVRFKLTGSTYKRLFERFPAQIMAVVYGLHHPARVLTQGTHPPWWLSIPFARDGPWNVQFSLGQTEDVQITLQYDGAADLDLTEMVLYRETYDHR